MRRESLKKDEAASDRESVSELDDTSTSEKKGSKKVVWRFMNCWWKAGGVSGNSLRLGVWITIHVGRPKGHPIEEDEPSEAFGTGASLCTLNSMMNISSSRPIFYASTLTLISVFGHHPINLWEVILHLSCRARKSEPRSSENKCLCSKESRRENKGPSNKWWAQCWDNGMQRQEPKQNWHLFLCKDSCAKLFMRCNLYLVLSSRFLQKSSQDSGYIKRGRAPT